MRAVAHRFRQLTDIASPQTRDLGIGGSLRQNGNFVILLAQILQGLTMYSIPTKNLHLRDILSSGDLVPVCPTHNTLIFSGPQSCRILERFHRYYHAG